MTQTLNHPDLGELRFEHESYWTGRLLLAPHREATKVLLPGSKSGPFDFAAEWVEGLEARYPKLSQEIHSQALALCGEYPEALSDLPRRNGLPVFETLGELWDYVELRVVELIDHWEFELVYSFAWAPEDFHVLHFDYGALTSAIRENRSFLLVEEG